MSAHTSTGRRAERTPSVPFTLLFLTDSLATNHLARAHCLYLTARGAGHRIAGVVTTGPGDVWMPLANTDFARLCRRVDADELAGLMGNCDVVVAFKAFDETLGVAHRAERAGGSAPVVVDIDDPDLEVRINWKRTPPRALAHIALRPISVGHALSLRRIARRHVCISSNPVLQGIYGGEVVPHPTPDSGPGSPHVSEHPLVSFIGTDRPHKGLPVLRSAVAELAKHGFRLLITAEAPPDAQPWEQWVGNVDAQTAAQLLLETDIVALPSRPWGIARGQLPMKLTRAMLAGRAVAVSRVGAHPWAVGDGGLVFEPDSVASLIEALAELQSPARRTELGDRARQIALDRFTPEAVAPAFERALLAATRATKWEGTAHRSS